MADDNAQELLENAIARQASCALSIPSGQASYQSRGRLLASETGGIRVLVDGVAMTTDAAASLIQSRQPIGVVIADGADLLFAAPLLQFDGAYLLEGRSVATLLLQVPSALSTEQRRKSYRVEVTAQDNLKARVWKIDDHVVLRDRVPPSQELQANLIDLSTGGMRVELAARAADALRLIDSQRLRIELKCDNEEVLIDGRVRRPIPQPRQDGRVVVGVSFQNLHRDIEGRRVQGVLAKFVGKLQLAAVRRQVRRAA